MRHVEFGNPTFCKILPELPKPEKLRRQIRKDGGYDMVPAYSPEEMYKYGELCVSEAIAALQVEPATKQPADLDQIIDNYVDDYEMLGETEDGRDACHTPTESERALIKDAICGLLADTDWDNAWGAHIKSLSTAEPVPMTDAQAEHGWLIECNIAISVPYWLTADNTNTNDANEALRFARKTDAEGFLKVFLAAHFGDDTFGIYKRHFSPEKYSVTEHMFIGIKPKGE